MTIRAGDELRTHRISSGAAAPVTALGPGWPPYTGDARRARIHQEVVT